ncbi:hypothetical protein HU200_012500 [Digitaria exilis]|uniref:Uncharacterized protein n=1 Tax=Digitaria exilis TaxID=1010633 RepID=A0A835FFH0_9POAL|nr:hypothetical protein HU200_012500 [Digitaria exilis]
MARHSAFFASRAACPSGSSGEFSARRICRYSDSTTGRFRARSSAVAQISPLPPPPFAILPPPCSPRRTTDRNRRVLSRNLEAAVATGVGGSEKAEYYATEAIGPVCSWRVNGLEAHDLGYGGPGVCGPTCSHVIALQV